MMEHGIKDLKDETILTSIQVSHVCSVCGRFELPEAKVAVHTFWLCSDCINKLTNLLYPKKNSEGIMRYHE